jgi:hypothetical protein
MGEPFLVCLLVKTGPPLEEVRDQSARTRRLWGGNTWKCNKNGEIRRSSMVLELLVAPNVLNPYNTSEPYGKKQL